ncbi:hypothetical protein QZH41_004183 [Actinostola sp. cb2023]|nr:hypothetical protein QZH41_004183 [Actinostola sp. cb2023]
MERSGIKITGSPSINSMYRDKMLDRLNSLRCDALLCDVFITAQCHEFHAHRAVLAASSDYFKALFTTAMVEKNTDRINLDVSAFIVEELLTFLYTGKTALRDDNVKELLIAADYLVLDELKSKCVDYLTSVLSFDNCIEVLSLSTHCNCPILREKVHSYILKDFHTIMRHFEFTLMGVDDLEWFVCSER